MNDPISSALIAAATSAGGMIISAVSFFAAGSADFTPWAQVGGTATAVGALAYIAKMMVDGKLVSLPVAELIKKSEKREEEMDDLIESSMQREDALRALLLGRAAK